MAKTRIIIDNNVYCFEVKIDNDKYALPIESGNILTMCQEDLFSLLNDRKILQYFSLHIVGTERNNFIVIFNEVDNGR